MYRVIFGLLFVLSTASQAAFQEMTVPAQMDRWGETFGASWGDFNGDGLPDLWVGNHANAPSLFLNNGDGTFVDIINDVWPGNLGDTHGASWIDFDNDGDQDLLEVVGGGGVGSNFLFLNEDGTFFERAAVYGIDSHGARSRSSTWIDWNRDGLLDVLLSHALGTEPQPFILTNNGSFFSDATGDTGISEDSTITTYIADISGDDIVDIILSSGNANSGPVYDTTTLPFEDLSSTLNIPRIGCSDSVIADFNGDLSNDIFASCGGGGREVVQRNEKLLEMKLSSENNETAVEFHSTLPLSISVFPAFEFEPAEHLRVGSHNIDPVINSHPELGWRSFSFDLDPQDPGIHGSPIYVPGADLGLFISFDAERAVWRLALSSPTGAGLSVIVNGTGTIDNIVTDGFSATPSASLPFFNVRTTGGFEDRLLQSGFDLPLPCPSAVGADFDNDMDVDIYLVCSRTITNLPNMLFLNDGNANFVLEPDAGGASGSPLGSGDSVVTADYDGDGFLDLFVTNGDGSAPFNDGPQQLFRNIPNDNNWLEIDLVGSTSNRDAIGAIVTVQAAGNSQIRTRDGGFHRRSQNHKRLHFGLAQNSLVSEVEVRWPGGNVDTFFNIPVNRIITIKEAGNTDIDNDGILDIADNCLDISNKYQSDNDEDGEGDACEAPEANGFWLDFANPDTMIHIYGLYFHTTNTQIYIGGEPATSISVLDSAHIVATVQNGQLIEPITITVTTPNGSDKTPGFATLIDRGGGLIYDTELNVTWLQDANYASTSGFDNDGFMTWPVAMSWASSLSYYDSERDKTWEDWRLPSALNKDGSGPCFAFDCINSEMGHLYYINQIKPASPGPFTNSKLGSYWSSTGRAPLPGTAWVFTTGTGKQDFSGPLEETLGSYGWAVRDGDVAASVPFAHNDSFSITKGMIANIHLTLNDTGTDEGFNLASISIVSEPSNGQIESINSDGSVDYRHDGSDTVADSFTYTINDANGVTSNVASVGILIYLNKPPVANDDSGVVNEGETVNFDLAANDSDDDHGLDLASIRLTSEPGNGSVVVNNDGTVDYTEVMPGATDDSFGYVISDLAGSISNTAKVTIKVEAVTATLTDSSSGSGGGLQPPLIILVLLSFLLRGFIIPDRKVKIMR